MIIEIQTHDRQFIYNLLGKDSASIGDIIDVPGNAKLKYDREIGCKSEGIPNYLCFILSFGSSFLVSLFANWFYDKLKNHKDKIKMVTINRKKIEIDKEQIKEIIEEQIKVEYH